MWSKELEEKALAGDSYALYKLGESYEHGLGIKKKLSDAI